MLARLERERTMSEKTGPLAVAPDLTGEVDEPAPRGAAAYGVAGLLVAAAAILAFVAERIAPRAEVSLIFVLPVVLAAATSGWGPALAAGVAGVLAFDFFFLDPHYTLRVTHIADLLSLGLLAVIAAVVSSVAARARGRGAELAVAQIQTDALAELSRACAHGADAEARLAAGAVALSRVFAAPAVIYARRELAMTPAAVAGDPVLGPAEEAAARWALGSQVQVRAGSYPHDASRFDVWPLGGGLVAGVDFTRAARGRPRQAAELVNVIGALLRAG
jgi:two-component system sensor histidine kinase KdpD